MTTSTSLPSCATAALWRQGSACFQAARHGGALSRVRLPTCSQPPIHSTTLSLPSPQVGQVQDGEPCSWPSALGGGAPNASRQSFRASARCRFASNPTMVRADDSKFDGLYGDVDLRVIRRLADGALEDLETRIQGVTLDPVGSSPRSDRLQTSGGCPSEALRGRAGRPDHGGYSREGCDLLSERSGTAPMDCLTSRPALR